jgi:hypothetical protein
LLSSDQNEGELAFPSLSLDRRSDIRHDVGMKSFTVRDLDRGPALVLDACDRDGVVRIRRRDGRTYRLESEHKPKVITTLPDFAARRRRIFHKPLTVKQAALLDRVIAGD